MRGYDSSGVTRAIREAGGEVFGVSSEPQVLATKAQQDWQLSFETVGDPHHDVSRDCRERGWLEIFWNERLEFLRLGSAENGQPTPSHPKGYFQPGVLVVSRDGRVLYRWRSVPSRKNIGGAAARPTPDHVWDRIREALDAPEGAADAALDTDPLLDQRGVWWPLFVALLIANGWFRRVRPFQSIRRVRVAGLRLLGFLAGWGAAFAWLPPPLVAIALAGWLVWITPQVRLANREFQNVEAG